MLTPSSINSLDAKHKKEIENAMAYTEQVKLDKFNLMGQDIQFILEGALEGEVFLNSFQYNISYYDSGSISEISLNIYRAKYMNPSLLFLTEGMIDEFILYMNNNFCSDGFVLESLYIDPGMIYMIFSSPELPIEYDEIKLQHILSYIHMATDELILQGEGIIIEEDIDGETKRSRSLMTVIPLENFISVDINKLKIDYQAEYDNLRRLNLYQIGVISESEQFAIKQMIVEIICHEIDEPVEPDPDEPIIPDPEDPVEPDPDIPVDPEP